MRINETCAGVNLFPRNFMAGVSARFCVYEIVHGVDVDHVIGFMVV